MQNSQGIQEKIDKYLVPSFCRFFFRQNIDEISKLYFTTKTSSIRNSINVNDFKSISRQFYFLKKIYVKFNIKFYSLEKIDS